MAEGGGGGSQDAAGMLSLAWMGREAGGATNGQTKREGWRQTKASLAGPWKSGMEKSKRGYARL